MILSEVHRVQPIQPEVQAPNQDLLKSSLRLLEEPVMLGKFYSVSTSFSSNYGTFTEHLASVGSNILF